MTYEKSVSEEELNKRSIDQGAARVTREGLEANIVHENYFTAHNGATAALAGMDGAGGVVQIPEGLRLVTYCVLTLRNGFTVTGQSACADPNNFNADIGREIARGDAVRQVWGLMGYELRTKLHNLTVLHEEDLGEALTRLTAYTLGNEEVFRLRDADLILKHFMQQEDFDHAEEGQNA